MAIKQAAAVAAIEKTAGKIITASLCEVPGGWLALADGENGRRLVFASEGETPLKKMFAAEKSAETDGVHVDIMLLNANNAAVVRRFVKWAAPTACGSKGTSIGFSDWLGAADAFVTDLFAKRRLKPVLVDYAPEDSEALQRNFLEAVDTATWGVLAAGYKEGYGANAAGLKTEEEIVKALLYGYSMIGFDCSDKINLGIEKMSDEDVEKRFNEFPDEFRKALAASYLNAEFKVNNNKISFNGKQLRRIVLEYGEAIMHVQFIYNSYLKNTPWDIDFELSLSKPGKVLTPQEHYLIANELQRNGIRLSSICIDPLNDQEALNSNLQLHCDIADTYGYRLSIKNADLCVKDPAAAAKAMKGKIHFKLNNILWMSAVKMIAANNRGLYEKIAAAAGGEPAENICGTDACRIFALSYSKVLNPKKSTLVEDIKTYIFANQQAYAEEIRKNVSNFLKNL